MPRCQFIKKDGEQCGGWAISDGSGLCVFHCSKTSRKEIIERPLSREERIIIISRQIRSLKRSKCNQLDKSHELRSLMELLIELEGGEKKNKKVDSLEEKLSKWETKSQIS